MIFGDSKNDLCLNKRGHIFEVVLDKGYSLGEETLRRHKENDATRSRNFFEQYLKTLLPLKRKWFAQKENVDFLSVEGLSVQEVGERVKQWCDACIRGGV